MGLFDRGHSDVNFYLFRWGGGRAFSPPYDTSLTLPISGLCFRFVFCSVVSRSFLLHSLKYARFIIHVCRSVATTRSDSEDTVIQQQCASSFASLFAFCFLFPGISIDQDATTDYVFRLFSE